MNRDLAENINAYKRKYYLNRLVKGILIVFSVLLGSFLLVNGAEYLANFNSIVRAVLFFSFILFSSYFIFDYLMIPMLKLLKIGKTISDEEAALQVGNYYADIKDKLLNTLQLANHKGALAQAALNQRGSELSRYVFAEAIDIRQNSKYLKFFLPTILAFVLTYLLFPQIITESTPRLIHYNQTFIPKAPFQFVLKSNSLQAYKSEDYQIQVQITGKSLPENVFLQIDERKYKMEAGSQPETYQLTLTNLQKTASFNFEAAGFSSPTYELNVVSRPYLADFNVQLFYPPYLNKKPDLLTNAGSLSIPQGTTVHWKFKSMATDSLLMSFPSEGLSLKSEETATGTFEITRKILKNTSYALLLKNEFAQNKEHIEFPIEIIPDLTPKISAESFTDSVLNQYIVLAGNIQDDYGFTKLRLHYSITEASKSNAKPAEFSIPIKIAPRQLAQNFVFKWNIDSLRLKPNASLSYFVEVWDNDGVNGPKSAKSNIAYLKIPSKELLQKDLNATAEKAEKQLATETNETKELQKQLEKMKEKMKGKKTLSWQDKKSLEDLIKKQEDIQKNIEEIKKQNEVFNQKSENLNQKNEEIAKKADQLQKLLNELLDPETKKLYDELQKLLNDKNADMEKLQKTLEQLNKKEDNLNKDLDRALELFKQLQLEQKMDQAIENLEKAAEEQQKEGEESQKAKDKQALEKQKEDQKQLNDMFEQVKDDLKKLNELNNSLEDKNEIKDTKEEEKEVDENQDNSMEQMEKGDQKKAGGSQKKAADKMKKMAQKMKESKESMMQANAQENMEDLRYILENLLTLSFDQEEIMKELKKVNQLDPRYLVLSQKQLKLQDDAKIIEDSLRALAKRVFQIESFITKELNQMNEYLEEATEGTKARRPDISSGKGQLAMTSMNNLALMLSDVLKQMQQQMQQQMQGSKSCSKPGNGKPKPGSLGQLQKELNQRIDALKKGGKSGKQMSEELARMAQQQEAIRRALSELEKSQEKGKNKSGGLGELKEQMEKTEKDLVNKRLSQETLLRQQDILTRLLESEKAQKERDQDEKRESQTAKEKEQGFPPSLEKYLKAKEKQIELLKTQPPSFTNFYKQETIRYHNSLNQ